MRINVSIPAVAGKIHHKRGPKLRQFLVFQFPQLRVRYIFLYYGDDLTYSEFQFPQLRVRYITHHFPALNNILVFQFPQLRVRYIEDIPELDTLANSFNSRSCG